MVVLALIKVYLVWTNHRRDDFWIASPQRLSILQFRHRVARRDRLIAAGNKDPSFRSLEPDAIRKIAANDHLHAVRVQPFGSEPAVYVPQSLRRKLRPARHFDGPGVFRSHRPVRAVHVMSSPPG